MRKSLLVILALSLIVATVSALVIASHSPVGAQENLVENPGFESALGAANWTVDGSAGQVCSSGDIHEGECAASTYGTEGGTLTQNLSVSVLHRYKCWGWIYAETEVVGRIELTFMDSGDNPLGPAAVLSASNTSDYELETISIRAPLNADYLRIRLMGHDTVRFDNIGVQEPFFGCFIATAAYGTPLAGEIDVLRQFRDDYLNTNPAGRLLVSLYYEISPPLANLIDKHEGLRAVTRMVLEPIIWFCSWITAPPSP